MKGISIDYTLPDLYQPKRWMCSKCGLIFDYLFSIEEPGWPVFDSPLDFANVSVDEKGQWHYEEPDQNERCPRCDIDIKEIPLIPVIVSAFAIKPFIKTTFIVEDRSHKIVLDSIATLLGKDIDILTVGNSENVKKFFEHLKNSNLLDNAYFIVDGDNKQRIYPNEKRFIQLDKYCIENYLMDFEICACVVQKDINEIRQIVLDQLKYLLISSNTVLSILCNLLTIESVTDASLAHIDGSKLLEKLLGRFGTSLDNYVPNYIKECENQGRLEKILPYNIVNFIKNINLGNL